LTLYTIYTYSGNWSLIFADSLFTVCGYGIARLSGSHHVMIHSSDIEGPHGVAKGFHRNYALLPPNFMSYAQTSFDPSAFMDRVRSAVDWLGSTVATNALSPVLPNFSFLEFNRVSSYSFTDMPESLYYPAPRTNDYFSYGSYCSQKKTLPQVVKEFVSNPSSRGTIVVAFGTLVPWNLSPPDKLDAVLRYVILFLWKAFNNLSDYRIIWSYKGRSIEVGRHGYAEILNKFLVTREYLEEKIRGILNNSDYKEKGKA
ncbi:hypothetical protein COOONC_22458, partial [Cooperia oncophora]